MHVCFHSSKVYEAYEVRNEKLFILGAIKC